MIGNKHVKELLANYDDKNKKRNRFTQNGCRQKHWTYVYKHRLDKVLNNTYSDYDNMRNVYVPNSDVYQFMGISYKRLILLEDIIIAKLEKKENDTHNNKYICTDHISLIYNELLYDDNELDGGVDARGILKPSVIKNNYLCDIDVDIEDIGCTCYDKRFSYQTISYNYIKCAYCGLKK